MPGAEPWQDDYRREIESLRSLLPRRPFDHVTARRELEDQREALFAEDCKRRAEHALLCEELERERRRADELEDTLRKATRELLERRQEQRDDVERARRVAYARSQAALAQAEEALAQLSARPAPGPALSAKEQSP